MGVLPAFWIIRTKSGSDTLLWQQLGLVVKKLLGLFCFSQLCLDVPVRAVANDTGMVGFHRNCKVDERFHSALIW